jgi:hypothetical protein
MPVALAICIWKARKPGLNEHDSVEVLCPGCGKHHEHGAEEGLRLAHCREHERLFPSYYIIFPEYLPVKFRR